MEHKSHHKMLQKSHNSLGWLKLALMEVAKRLMQELAIKVLLKNRFEDMNSWSRKQCQCSRCNDSDTSQYPWCKRYDSKIWQSFNFSAFFMREEAIENDSLGINGREYYEALANVEGVSPMEEFCFDIRAMFADSVWKCAMADAEISISENGDVIH